MKTYHLFLLSIAIMITFSDCSSLTECDNIKQSEAIILIDVSDPLLFNEIEKDITQNFPGFMQRTRMGSINPCQRFTLSFAHLSSKDALELSSESISISRKGLSRKEEKKQANPAPLVRLLKQKIDDFRLLTNNSNMTSGSNIANVLFKTIIQTNPDANNVILLFSDMVENNQVNFYKKIPDEKDIPLVIEKMIEPTVLQKFKSIQERGLETKIIIVLKPEPSGKTSLREIKKFWTTLFSELNLDGQVQFIDNLTNAVEL